MNTSIRNDLPLPPDALLATYAAQGAYTDCYATDVAGAVTRADYVESFYAVAP